MTERHPQERETRYPVQVELAVAWGEMDALGHVNNVVYFRYFESARIAYFSRLGASFSPAGPIVASASCDFLAPLAYPDTLRVGVGVTRVGTTSFTMRYELTSRARGLVAARGRTVCVWYDYALGAKARLPDPLRVRLDELEDSA